MAQASWATCPAPIRAQVEGFVADTCSILENNLATICLHGSLAMGCFNPERSDLDLLVITEHGMALHTKRAIAEMLLRVSNAPRPIEISFVIRNVLDPWQYPTPYDFHYSDDWREKTTAELAGDGWRQWNDVVRTDRDLAAHAMITRHRGICLAGLPIQDVVPLVPSPDYIDALMYDVGTAPTWIADNPVYGILNLCRVLWYLRDGQICSKDEGGVWGTRSLPEHYRGLVADALAIYRGERPETGFDGQQVVLFATYMIDQINAALAQPAGADQG